MMFYMECGDFMINLLILVIYAWIAIFAIKLSKDNNGLKSENVKLIISNNILHNEVKSLKDQLYDFK